MFFPDPRLATPESRANLWATLQQAVERGQAAAREVQQQVLEEGLQVGDWVALSPLLTGQIVAIEVEGTAPPVAVICSECPTGRRGEVETRSERRPLKGLQPAHHSVGLLQPPPPELGPVRAEQAGSDAEPEPAATD